jgi:acyl transferase domain-containing protein/acyl carrier protein/NAD(P)-dependent dehydrogenase (short-subunit alcohol dehydrogenase family)
MSAYSIDAALAQLEDQIDNCEKALIRVIEEKKMSSEKSMSINKINRQLQQNPIAIVGMASLLPQARNLQEYWQNIVNKIDCITDIPESHWNVEDYYDPDPRTTKDKTYCKRGGFIPYVDFNPMEFGLPPNILEVTDVSQLLGLVVAKEAMEDAGYSQSHEFNRENVGVVLGVAQGGQLAMPLAARLQYPVWEKVLKSSGLSDEDTQKIIDKIKSAYVQWNENAFPGILGNVVAGRIANRLNLGGLNCVVDAACASSFGALKMAISELVEHRSDMMLTGGVDIDNSIMAYISFSKTPAVSPSENVKPFDAKSDGMMLGEGIGMIVLKRLEDAERDNDKIYAVIKGIGTSSDGRYKSIYAPRQEGQVKALKRAYEDAGFAPETVGLIEAHGTGTMAGDPTEFGSLKDFFGAEENAKRQHIALGSVKSQIGHTKAAAGAASLIKTALALHHKILPPTINITEPNPKLNIKNSAFYLNTETRPWIRAEGQPPRRAGVSSFGFGGTNYHVVLEEYEAEHNRAYRLHNSPAEIFLFAETPAQLLNKCQEMLGKLRSELGARSYAQLVEECKSLEIPLNTARVGFVTDSLSDACKFLQISIDLLKNKPSAESWEHPQGIYYRQSGLELQGKVVSLFSGQGSQYLEMGRELVMNFPTMRSLYGQMDSLLLKDNLQPLSQIVFPHPVFEEAEKNAQIAALQRTEYAQPAIGVLSAGLYKILQSAGFKSDFVAGHSFGELTALWAAGVLSEEDYLFLVKARGQAMAAPQDPNYDTGAMLAVKEELSKVEAVTRHYPQVAIANFNSPNQIVLAGPTEAIAKVRQALQDQGYTAVLLPVSAAFHTPLIAFAQKAFAIASKTVTLNSPKIPVYSNVSGNAYPKESVEIHKILESHLSSSVLFKQEIENIYAAGGYCFVEFGPRRILSNLVKEILGNRPHLTIALNPSTQKNSDRSLREAAVQMRVVGLPLQNLDPYEIPQTLPTSEPVKGLTVRLNGTNHVPEKSKNTFMNALQDGHKVKLPASHQEVGAIANPVYPTPITTANGNTNASTNGGIKLEAAIPTPAVRQNNGNGNRNGNGNGNGHNGKSSTATSAVSNFTNSFASNLTTIEKPKIQQATLSHQPAQESKTPMTPDKILNYQRILESLEYVLTQFQQNQSENLQVHGTYLEHQVEYAQTFFQLMQQQNTLFAQNQASAEAAKLKPVVMESLERSMMQFHTQQGETLRIHEQYLKSQVEYTKNFFQVLQQEYSQLISGEHSVPPVVSVDATIPANNERDRLIALEKNITEGPVPPTTQILQTQSAPVAEEPVTASAKPLEETPPTPVVVRESSPLAAPVVPEPVTPAAVVVPEPVAVSTQVVAAPTATIDLSDLGKNLLAITSDKTGYPIEMLEMDMDMEADLGIDSIKRVEILGGLQEMYPDLPKPNVEDLGELRTIGQVVEYLQSHAGQSATVEITTFQVKTATSIQAIAAPESIETVEVTNPEPVVSIAPIPVKETVALIPEPESAVTEAPTTDLSKLADNLLAITSDKTGYPVEMLELDMDMEADLGIDSIKRVEILGALQEMYPDLPKPNVEELGELRTIGQIVLYIQQLVGNQKKNYQHKFDEQSTVEQVNHNVKRLPAKLKSLPEPDYLDFSLPEGHICLITDDGSLTTSQVAQSLIEKGWKVVVLSFPQSLVPQQSPLPPGAVRVTLADMTEDLLQHKLSAIATNDGAIGAFIHIHPAFGVSQTGGISFLEPEKAIVKHVFFMAKHLKKSLNEAARYGRSCFCTVARLDGAFGLEHKANYGVIGAGLFGLTKTLRWEWQKVFTRAIDLNPELNPEQSAHHIIAEIHDSNLYISEVGYSSHGRTTLIAD